MAAQRFVEMRDMFTQTIGALAEAVDKRDPFTAQHSVRVKGIAVDIGRVMRVNDAELEALEWGGLLHDVGKIGISDAILQKPAPLTPDEAAVMRTHPDLGAHIVSAAELYEEAEWILHHHERVDGGGYPDGLAGEQIPLESRIILVADAFEAITADRPYRMHRSADAAMVELERNAGTQFDPDCVAALGRVVRPQLWRAA
jgi:putative nucleotidyltransferase with HDIG domain